MEYLAFLVGLVIGGAIVRILTIRKTATGVLLIDHFDEDKDIYQLNIDRFDLLYKKKRILLKVDHDAILTPISQEKQTLL